MKKYIYIVSLILCLLSYRSYAQSSNIRYAQLITENPDSANSNFIVDITFLSLDSFHDVQLRYGTSSNLSAYFTQIFSINSTISVDHNLITDAGLHTNVSIGYFPLDMDNVLTITLLDASGAVVENKQFK